MRGHSWPKQTETTGCQKLIGLPEGARETARTTWASHQPTASAPSLSSEAVQGVSVSLHTSGDYHLTPTNTGSMNPNPLIYSASASDDGQNRRCP